MIRFFRRILVIALLYTILIFVGNLTIGFDHQFIVTLVKLGFIILTASTLGELSGTLGLSKIPGYIFAGLIFGDQLIPNYLLKPVITEDLLGRLGLLNNITISLFSILVGLSLRKENIIIHSKYIRYNLLFSLFFILFLLTPVIFFTVIYFLNISFYSVSQIVALSVFASVLLINSSFEFNYSLGKELNLDTEGFSFINTVSVTKELFTYLLFFFSVLVYAVFNNNFLDGNIFSFGVNLLFAVLMGIILFGITLLYTKYVKSEILIFIITLVVLGSEVCRILQLNIFITFLTTGLLLNRYLEDTESFKVSTNKILAPLLVLFFVLFVAQLKFSFNYNLLYAGIIIFISLTLIKFFNIKLSALFSNLNKNFSPLNYFSFYTLGITTIIILTYYHPILNEINFIYNLILPILLINTILSPIAFRFGVYLYSKKLVNRLEEKQEEKLDEEKSLLQKINKTRVKFIEPNIPDLTVNKSLYKILFELNTIFSNFEKKFILSRSEESAELIIEITEYYTEEYIKLKNKILTITNNYSAIKSELLSSEERTLDLYLTLTENRKGIEKKILLLEPLIKDIFHSLSDLTDTIVEYANIKINPNSLKFKKENGFKLIFIKSWYNFKYLLFSLFKKDYSIFINLHYKNLVKYYLLGQSANEILETVNLVGVERLNTLRQIKKLFDHQIGNIQELIKLLDEEKDNPALSNIIYDKYEELHTQFINEISAIQSEINETGNQISNRLRYALANPFNNLVNTINSIISLDTPPVTYKYSKIYSIGESARENALETIRYWINYYLGFLGFFQKSAIIYKLQTQLNTVINQSLGQIVNEINENLKSLISEVKSKIKQLSQNFNSNELSFPNLIDKANILLIHDCFNKHLTSLEHLRKSKKFNLLIEDLIKSFSQISKKLPENVLMLKESDLIIVDRLPGFIELKSVPIRLSANNLLEYKLPREIGEVNELLINYLNLSVLEIKNLFSIAEYHLQTAGKELEKEQDETEQLIIKEIIESLFDKLKIKTTQLEEEVYRIDKNLTKKIHEKVEIVISEINGIIDYRLLQYTSKKSSQTIKDSNFIDKISIYIYKINFAIKKLFETINSNYNTYLKKYILKLLVYWGFKKQPETLITSHSIYSNEKKLANLPFIYRKLFDGAPLETSDFFIGREKFIELVKIAFNKYYENKPSSLIIIGEPGSGKKSLINTIKNFVLKDVETIHYQLSNSVTTPSDLLSLFSKLLGFTKQLTKDELIAELNDKSNKRIFLIENIGKLYLRKHNGYEALKLFKIIVAQTQSNTFWICTCGKYVWDFYNVNFTINEIFTERIYTNLLHKKDIRSILLSRHNATGFDLEFQESNFYKLKSKFFKIKSKTIQQEELANEFFDKLEEYAGGNIISAMYYWLISIDQIKNNKLIMRPPHQISLNIFNEISPDYFIILALLFRHGWLADTEIAEMLFTDLREIKSKLNYLANIELIYKDKIDLNSDKYFINKFVYKIIESELLKRNLI
jgi:hypothetical protein